MSFVRDLASRTTILGLGASVSALIVPFTHCWWTCSNFQYACRSALHSSLHPERRESFWPWGGILSAVVVSSVYFKMHKPTLIWNELFTLWFLNILLLQWLPSWSHREVHGWVWNGINNNQAFLLNLQGLHMAFSEKVEVILTALLSYSLYGPFLILSITCNYKQTSLFSASLCLSEAKHMRTCHLDQFTSHRHVILLLCGSGLCPMVHSHSLHPYSLPLVPVAT